MFDVAWSELALIGAVALVVIGPKDLPKVMRTMGQWTRKARLLAGEFQHSLDEMVRQAELDEVREHIRSVNPAAVRAKMESVLDTKALEESLDLSPLRTPMPMPAPEDAQPGKPPEDAPPGKPDEHKPEEHKP